MSSKIRIVGGTPLRGRIRIGGAKNAVLPILAASLLPQGEVRLREVPWLEDVDTICRVLAALGARVSVQDGEILVRSDWLRSAEAPYALVRKMRASVLVMGPLLARLGYARVPHPGGCNIGSRPIDLHLKGLEAMGAHVGVGNGFVEVRAERLRGASIYLDFPSVGATENLLMAATLAEGTTIIENAAEEPEVVDLANFLVAAGARIRGAGTRVIRVDGVDHLEGTVHTVIPDRIEAGTYLMAAAITGGDVVVENVVPQHLTPVLAKLRDMGARVEAGPTWLRVTAPHRLRATEVKTLPYPGFPTDLQAPIMAVLSVAEGLSTVTETVFENRFMHVDELKRMGARIKIEGRTAIIQGVPRLTAAAVRATDLRAGAALVLAGLAAEGVTEIHDPFHLDRGYAHLEERLASLGGRVERVPAAQQEAESLAR